MQFSKRAGLWLAVVACAGVAGWGFRQHDTKHVVAASVDVARVVDAPVVRIAQSPTREQPQPFPIDARIARAAVRAGELQIRLPDGRTQRIAIERHYTDETGHWNVIGRAPTRFGKGPMVLTFGGTAVFGLVPMPDGTSMHVETRPGGRVTVIPDGSWLPRNLRDPALAQDAVLPPTRGPGARTPLATSASPVAKLPAPKQLRTGAAAVAAPFDYIVLAVYTPEQVTLRGDDYVVRTELSNMVAIANLAHQDGGTGMRFQIYRTVLRTLPVATNAQALSYIANDQLIRDERGFLTFALRPHQPGDNCGAAYLPTQPHGRNALRLDDVFSVVNTDGECSPLTFAHETGHNLGGMHDRESETAANGKLNLGAYLDSYGHRTADFATIMARPDGRTYLPYFSKADSTLCGAPCGVADFADDARGFGLWASAVKQLIPPYLCVGIPDVEGIEPVNAATLLPVEIRVGGPSPVGGIPLQIDVIGGTATPGVDFEIATPIVTIPHGGTHATAYVRLLPENGDAGTETALLRISSLSAFPLLDDTDATITIVQPQRHVVTGTVVFDDGVVPPTKPIDLEVWNADDSPEVVHVTLSPPDFGFRLVVPHGAQPEFGEMSSPLWLGVDKPFVPEVRADTSVELQPQMAYRISGNVRAQDGMTLPTTYPFRFWHSDDTSWVDASFVVPQPGTHYSVIVPRGRDALLGLEFGYGGFVSYRASFWNVSADITHDIVAGSIPTLRAMEMPRSPQETGGVLVRLDSPAPAGGVSFRCSTSDGTAKAAKGDYLPMSATVTIPEGVFGDYFCGDLKTFRRPGFTSRYLWFTLDQVTGALLTTPSAPVHLGVVPMRTGGPGQKTPAH